MAKPTDVRPIAAAVYFLPIKTRMPLKFGPEIITEVTCARIRVTVADTRGRRAEGWGETPLSVQWVPPMTRSARVSRQRRSLDHRSPRVHPVQGGFRTRPVVFAPGSYK